MRVTSSIRRPVAATSLGDGAALGAWFGAAPPPAARSVIAGAGSTRVFFDVPSLTFTDGPLEFAAPAPVMISPKAAGVRDQQLGYTLGMSLFPFLPG